MSTKPCTPCDGFGYVDAVCDTFSPEPVMVQCINCRGEGVFDAGNIGVVHNTRRGKYWTVTLNEHERAELLNLLRMRWDEARHLEALRDILKLES